MRISDWSSDVCSSDLTALHHVRTEAATVVDHFQHDPILDHVDLDHASVGIGALDHVGQALTQHREQQAGDVRRHQRVAGPGGAHQRGESEARDTILYHAATVPAWRDDTGGSKNSKSIVEGKGGRVELE